MISVKCIRCKKELDNQGGLLFSPPNNTSLSHYGLVEKHHLCIDCYWIIKKELEEK